MKSRAALIMLLLFVIGLAAGWLVGTRQDGAGLRHTGFAKSEAGPAPARPQRASVVMPEASGLPGDTLHLSTATDVRVLRAAWENADEKTRKVLAKRWTEIDPADGIRFLLVDEVDGEPRNKYYGDQIAGEWGKRDGAAFLAFAANHDSATLDRFSAGIWEAVRSELTKNADGLVAFWKAAPAGVHGQMQYILFNELFISNPARALQEVEHLNARERATVWTAADKVADPEPVLRAMLRLEGARADPNRIISLLRSMAGDSPALQEITLSLPPGEARSSGCRSIVCAMAAKDPDAALAWLEAHEPTNENRALVATALLKTDLARAMEIGGRNLSRVTTVIGSNGATCEFQEKLQSAVTEAARKDWSATASLVLNSPSQQIRSNAVKAMASALDCSGDQAIPSMEKLAALIVSARAGPEALSSVTFTSLKEAQFPAVTAWLQQQPENIRDPLLHSLSFALTGGTGEPAQVALLSQFPPSPQRSELIISRTADWAARDPSAAAEFAVTLPPGTERDYTILNTAIAWHRNAPEAARAWVESLPESPGKARALQELASRK